MEQGGARVAQRRADRAGDSKRVGITAWRIDFSTRLCEMKPGRAIPINNDKNNPIRRLFDLSAPIFRGRSMRLITILSDITAAFMDSLIDFQRLLFRCEYLSARCILRSSNTRRSNHCSNKMSSLYSSRFPIHFHAPYRVSKKKKTFYCAELLLLSLDIFQTHIFCIFQQSLYSSNLYSGGSTILIVEFLFVT